MESYTANREILRPYIGGEDLNTLPDQNPVRCVIDFSHYELSDARRWPDLISIVEERVRPERERLRDDQATARLAKQYWWRHWAPRAEAYARLRQLRRCLVSCIVTKHLAYSFQPVDRVFANTINVHQLQSSTAFASLQSRVHDAWARAMGSSLEERLRYNVSDCFETFPFPEPDPRAVIPALEDIGQRLYDARAAYMLDEQVGLTITYNRLKDLSVDVPRIVELRRLHEELDAAVLAAYGWSDIPVPPFCDPDPEAFEAFENEVIDRLFALNAKRAEEERIAGAATAKGAKGGKKKRASKKAAKPTQPTLFGDEEGN